MEKQEDGKQRYICRNKTCSGKPFIREYAELGRLPEVKEQIIEMSINGSGVRDIARVLKISPTTAIEELKKKESAVQHVNLTLVKQLNPSDVLVELRQHIEGAECDEMWSFVGSKAQ